jgi:hyperosmotically inducible protein
MFAPVKQKDRRATAFAWRDRSRVRLGFHELEAGWALRDQTFAARRFLAARFLAAVTSSKRVGQCPIAVKSPAVYVSNLALMKIKNLSVLVVLIASPIALFASSETDRKIETAAKASYNYRTVLEDHVKVKANDGVVTLTGTVQDKDDKALAEDTVENLPGVTSVKNEITVKSTYSEHSDSWMAFKIRSRLLVKANVSAATTTVAVQDGVVTLGGTAANVAQKELTEVYAKEIDWVKSVKNNIVVKDTPATGETIGEKIDDASITTQVKYALLSHKGTSALKTKITTTDGVVRVSGEANSDAEKSLVTKLAQDVRGTRSVTNDMIVKN